MGNLDVYLGLELSLFDFSVKKEEGRNESVDFLFYVAGSSMSVD